jgi:hypothetical protein
MSSEDNVVAGLNGLHIRYQILFLLFVTFFIHLTSGDFCKMAPEVASSSPKLSAGQVKKREEITLSSTALILQVYRLSS